MRSFFMQVVTLTLFCASFLVFTTEKSVKEPAGLTFARKYLTTEEIDYLTKRQVSGDMAKKIEAIFTPQIQEIFKKLNDKGYDQKLVDELKKLGFKYFESDKPFSKTDAVFMHEKLPKKVFKILGYANDKDSEGTTWRLRNLGGRIWYGDFLRDIAAELPTIIKKEDPDFGNITIIVPNEEIFFMPMNPLTPRLNVIVIADLIDTTNEKIVPDLHTIKIWISKLAGFTDLKDDNFLQLGNIVAIIDDEPPIGLNFKHMQALKKQFYETYKKKPDSDKKSDAAKTL